ncbi:MAG: LCP family protein [Acidimicrobiales bacterium]|nr:LCP family protein [Acidimicrobiales bacterium]
MRPESVGPQRRTAGQRALLGLGTLLVLALLAGAGAVAWTSAKFRSIDREDVLLDEPVSGPANYLIVGSDSRSRVDPDDPGGDGSGSESRAALADTMMIVRIDPESETVKMLSMPRDLWVTLPNGKKGRLNAAYAHGPQELIDTLRTELGIPINHYIEVDFKGFQGVVDAIGGVPMWFDRAMRDRNSGLDVLHPGCVTLDGRSALAFARARHLQYWEDGGFEYDGTGDLGRISRQQVFVRRVLDRASDRGFGNPITMKRLIEVGVDNVTLDGGLSVGTLIGIGERFADFDSDDLQTFTVPATPRTTDGGAAVLDIDRTAAEPILAKFRDEPAGATTTTPPTSSSTSPSSTSTIYGESTSTSEAEATTTTTSATTASTEPVGIVPGDPPPGKSCG